MASKRAKELLAEIFPNQKIGKNAEVYLIELLYRIAVERKRDHDRAFMLRQFGEAVADDIKESNRFKRFLAKTQPKKMPRAKKKPGIRVTIEKWNPNFKGRDPQNQPCFLLVQLGDAFFRPDRKRHNSQGLSSFDQTVELAKQVGEILGVTPEIPAKLE
jgi:hypothetical protein